MKNKKKFALGIIFFVSFWTYTGLSLAQNSLIAQESPLFQPIPTKNQGQTKLALVNNLPNLTINELTASIIKILLAVCGSFALISFTVGGIIMITAQGDESKISKGKLILLWSVAGLAVIAVSYGIVVGVSQLQFFGGGAQQNQIQGTGTLGAPNQGLAPGSEDLKPGEMEEQGNFGGKAIKVSPIPANSP